MAAIFLLQKKYLLMVGDNEGQKISKSIGNVIDPYDIMNTYGLDQMRYFYLEKCHLGMMEIFLKRLLQIESMLICQITMEI